MPPFNAHEFFYPKLDLKPLFTNELVHHNKQITPQLHVQHFQGCLTPFERLVLILRCFDLGDI